MAQDEIEAADIVEEINNAIADKLERDQVQEHPLMFISNGYVHGVKYLGVTIYDSDNEERRFDGENGDYEPLKPFIIKQCQKVLEQATKEFKGVLTE